MAVVCCTSVANIKKVLVMVRKCHDTESGFHVWMDRRNVSFDKQLEVVKSGKDIIALNIAKYKV